MAKRTKGTQPKLLVKTADKPTPIVQPKRIGGKPKTTQTQRLLSELEQLWEKFPIPEVAPEPAMKGKPGIYADVSFEEYCRISAVNYSSCKALERSPAHYRFSEVAEESESMRSGTLIHTAILEPHDLLTRYVILPDLTQQIGPDPKTKQPYKMPKATSAYKALVEEFRKENYPKIVIDLDEFNSLVRINKSVYAHPAASALLPECHREITLIWNDPTTGILCKARIDALSHEYQVIFDLKTTDDIQRFELDRYCYHQQQAFYQYGYKVLTNETYTPYIGVVERNHPHAFVMAPVAESALKLGLEEMKGKLALLDHCRRTKNWPWPNDPECWDLKKWYEPFDRNQYLPPRS